MKLPHMRLQARISRLIQQLRQDHLRSRRNEEFAICFC